MCVLSEFEGKMERTTRQKIALAAVIIAAQFAVAFAATVIARPIYRTVYSVWCWTGAYCPGDTSVRRPDQHKDQAVTLRIR